MAAEEGIPGWRDEDYKLTRRKLISFFRHRGCEDPEDLADEVLARVVQRLIEGVKLTTDLAGFAYGIARHVLSEYRQSRYTSALPDANLVRDNRAARDIQAVENQDLVERCLDCLSGEEIAFLERSQNEPAAKLAQELGITSTAVRVRRHRIMARIRDHVRAEGLLPP